MSDEPDHAQPDHTLKEVEVPARRARGGGDEDEGQSSRRGVVLLVSLVGIGAAVAALALGGMKNKAIYSRPVDQLVAEKAKFAGRTVRAEGNLVHGSLVKRDQPCEYRFVIEKNGVQVPVRFAQCVVPDTFRDVPGMDVGVTVEGELTANDTFEASSVLAKCPSKYEMKEKAAHGERMPHQDLNGT